MKMVLELKDKTIGRITKKKLKRKTKTICHKYVEQQNSICENGQYSSV